MTATDVPTQVRYGKVVGHFVEFLGDSADVGDVPDERPLTGTVTLTPLTTITRWASTAPPRLAIAQNVLCPVVAGDLCTPGTSTPGAFVVATDQPEGQPTVIQWRAVFKFTGVAVQPDPVVFNVPTDGVVDLALVATIPPAPGTIVIVSHEDALAAADSAADAAASAEAAAQSAEDATVPTLPSYDIRRFINPGETLVSDGSGPGNNTAIFQRAMDALTALGANVVSQIYVPNGRYVLATTPSSNPRYSVNVKTRVGIKGESQAGVVFLADPLIGTTLFYSRNTLLTDNQFENFTIDGAAQTWATYTTGIKGMYIADMLRPRWKNVTIQNCWATGLGCDFLRDYFITNVTTINNGRGIGATGSDPLVESGGSGVGIGTGKYLIESGVVSGLISRGNGRGGLFYEVQLNMPYYSRGVSVIGAVLTGNAFGLQECGLDGLQADIIATDNTYAGVLLEKTFLCPKAGINGRITGIIDRNGSLANPISGNVVLGEMPDGNYRLAGTARNSPTYGVVSLLLAAIGPNVVLNLAADHNGSAGVHIQAAGAPISALTIAGSARDNGQNAAASRRDGVVVEAATDMLTMSADCVDDQATQTQQIGFYAKGAAVPMSRAKLVGDVRSNAAGGFVAEHTISVDSIVSLYGAGVPGPSLLVATPGNMSATLTWRAPAPSTGVTDYSVQYAVAGSGSWSTFARATSTVASQMVTGLTNGVAYDFQVAAIRSGTIGAYTAGIATATPGVPDTFADSFNRPNGTLAGSSCADGTSSTPWVVLDAGTGGVFSVNGNGAKATAGTGNVIAYVETGQADGAVHVDLTNVSGTNPVGCIAFRIQDTTNFLQVALRAASGNNTLTVQRRVANVVTTLITTALTSAGGQKIKVTFSGSTIKLYVNGTLVGTATGVTNFQTLTKHGMYANYAVDPTSRFDNWGFNVTPA